MGVPEQNREALARSIRIRAEIIARLAAKVRRRLSTQDIETLDTIDCDLERFRVWLERLSEAAHG